MTPLRVHDVVDQSAHTATYVGMQYTTSSGADMAVGTWNINPDGTKFWSRGHTQEQAEEMAREFDIDDYFILGRGENRIEAQFTDVTNIAVSGSSIGVVECDIQHHIADPTDQTLTAGEDWTLTFCRRRRVRCSKTRRTRRSPLRPSRPARSVRRRPRDCARSRACS